MPPQSQYLCTVLKYYLLSAYLFLFFVFCFSFGRAPTYLALAVAGRKVSELGYVG